MADNGLLFLLWGMKREERETMIIKEDPVPNGVPKEDIPVIPSKDEPVRFLRHPCPHCQY
jgi:hypothetical protein